MDPCTAAAWSLMERIGRDGGAPDTGGPYDQHGLLLRPRYRDISSIACPGMPRVSAPHFEAVLGQLLPHRGAWVHLSSTFEAGAPGAPPVLGFVFWDCEGDRWVRFAAVPWSAPDRSCLRHSETAGTRRTLPGAFLDAPPDHGRLHGVSPVGIDECHLSPSHDARAASGSDGEQSRATTDDRSAAPRPTAPGGSVPATWAAPDSFALLGPPPGLARRSGPP